MKTEISNPWKIVRWMVMGGALLLGTAIAFDQLQTKDSVRAKKPAKDGKAAVIEMKLDSLSKEAFALIKSNVYKNQQVGAAELALEQQRLPGPAQLKAIELGAKKAEEQKGEAELAGKMKELRELEEQLKSTNSSSKESRRSLVVADLVKFQQYGARATREVLSDVRNGYATPDHKAMYDEWLRVAFRITFQEVKDGGYEAQILTDRQAAWDEFLNRALETRRARP